MYKIVTFAPDMNPMTPGILVDCTGFYPSATGGMRAVPGENVMTSALPNECLGAFAFRDLDMSFRTIVGTIDKLYELSTTTWTDVSLAGGYATPRKWRFTAWGNYILATNYNKKIQVQTGVGVDFAEVAAAPVAKYITSSQNFVIAANISGSPNRVQWCAQGDYTDWTPSSSTQAGYMDLNDTQGDIRGIKTLGNDVVVFKESALYHGTYVGPPYIWAFRRIMSTCGAISQEGVLELESGIYYMGIDDLYFYDGNLPKRVGEGVRRWLLERIDGNYLRNVICIFDSLRKLIFWFYPLTSDGTAKAVEGIIFDYENGRWGRVVKTVESGLMHWSSNVTYDTIKDYFATYDLITKTYNDPWWDANTFSIAYFNSSHEMVRLNGTALTSQMITGDIGSLQSYTRIQKAWPYFTIEPTTCTITPRTKVKLSDTAVYPTRNITQESLVFTDYILGLTTTVVNGVIYNLPIVPSSLVITAVIYNFLVQSTITIVDVAGILKLSNVPIGTINHTTGIIYIEIPATSVTSIIVDYSYYLPAISLKADGSVDLDRTAKFHSLKIDCTGDCEITGFDAAIKNVAVN